MALIHMILQQVIFIALSSSVNVTGWHRQLSLTFIAYNTNIMASFVMVFGTLHTIKYQVCLLQRRLNLPGH